MARRETVAGNWPILSPAAGLEDVRIRATKVATERMRGATRARCSRRIAARPPFDGTLGIVLPETGPTRVASRAARDIPAPMSPANWCSERGGRVSGDLALAGGGLDGSGLVPPARRRDGRDIAVDVVARDAAFRGAVPIRIDRANIKR